MTPNEHAGQLNQVDANIQEQAQAAFDDMLRRIRNGADPRTAIREAQAGFDEQFKVELAAQFSLLLSQYVGVGQIEKYPIAGLKLSAKLYQNSKQVSATALKIIQEQANGFQNVRDLALKLYEGYDFKEDPLKVQARLPKYLRRLLKDPTLGPSLRSVLARAQASTLKTPALKAAYLDAITAIERNQGHAVITEKLRVAWYERNRYFANRIAQTELHNTYEDKKARELMQSTYIEWAEVAMSSTHPKVDICDVHAHLNAYGQGPGVYPKSVCPKPSFHPHCRCVVIPRPDIRAPLPIAPRHDTGLVSFIRAQDPRTAAQMIGSQAKRDALLHGKSLPAILNANTDPLYHFQTVGNFQSPALEWADEIKS